MTKCIKTSIQLVNYRKQRVKVGSTYSTFQNVLTGVPQVSVLGPLLFNIFINDMLYLNLESEIRNIADDTTVYACDKSIDTVIVKLEDDLQKILTWFKESGMCANPAMFLGLKIINLLCLNIDRQTIKQSEHVKIAWSPNRKQIKF